MAVQRADYRYASRHSSFDNRLVLRVLDDRCKWM